MTWSAFLWSQAAVTCDSACVDTVSFRRYYLLFFIDISTRQVFYARTTAQPTGDWTTQSARNLSVRHIDALAGCKALVPDRGSHLTAAFDEIFRTEGISIVKTPVRTPVANAFAERWIGTCAASSSTAPSSGTGRSSSSSSSTNSTTTTSTGPTDHSANIRHRSLRRRRSARLMIMFQFAIHADATG